MPSHYTRSCFTSVDCCDPAHLSRICLGRTRTHRIRRPEPHRDIAMMRRGRDRIAVVTSGQEINPRSDLNASVRRRIELTIAMRQCHHAATHRVVRLDPREDTAAARLDNHPTAIDGAELRDIVGMNSERAIWVFLAPGGIAENLVGI